MEKTKQIVSRIGRLPGVLALFAATALLLPSATSLGMESPLGRPVGLVVAAEDLQLPESLSEGETLSQHPDRIMVAEEIQAPRPARPAAETPMVEDTYFETVAFLGDSRTDGFRLYSGLKSGTYFVATGATVESVFSKAVETAAGEMPLLDFMAQAEQQPERIYVMLGVNELGWADIENYRNYYGQLVDRLRADHPGAEVILQSLPPVSRKQEELKTYVNNARIQRYNEIVREVAGAKNCPYVDVAAAVTDEEGFLPANWTYDGVHLNDLGCRAWLDYLRTHAINYDGPFVADAPAQTVE